MMHILTITESTRAGELLPNGGSKAERTYLDFIVSGKSLGQLFEASNKDLIGTFGWTENTSYENNQIDEYLGLVKPDTQTGRTSFYVCAECGDIGCGAITGTIEVTDHLVTWKDFGFENGVDAPHLSDYKNIGPFTFDTKEYSELFEKIRQRIQ